MSGALPSGCVVWSNLLPPVLALIIAVRTCVLYRWIRAMRCPDAVRGVVAVLCSGDLRQLERFA